MVKAKKPKKDKKPPNLRHSDRCSRCKFFKRAAIKDFCGKYEVTVFSMSVCDDFERREK